ncbi:MAG: ABC transporter ATP-binding protein [Elusimicrobiota bacterium]|nr:ABC transporter ATP-binding protein [Elusimicrobiota bacterium]
MIEFKNVSKKYFLETTSLRETIASIFTSKTRKGIWAVKDISFKLTRGETLGIIGPNGAGKTTILKLIAGVTSPTEGTLTVTGKVSSLIELCAGFHPELTGRENIFLSCAIFGMTRKETRERLSEIIEFAQLKDFIDMPLKRYSSGMCARLGFSTAVYTEADILLIDEILSLGDISFQKKAFEKLQLFIQARKIIIFVSHNLNKIQEICRRTIWLEGGRIKKFDDTNKVIDAYRGIDPVRSNSAEWDATLSVRTSNEVDRD